MSRSQGNGDGYSYCGDRAFKLANPSSVQNFLNLDSSNLLTLAPSSENDVATYQVEIMIYLVNNPATTKSKVFTVKVLEATAICASYVLDSFSLQNMEQNVYSSAKSQTIVVEDPSDGFCGLNLEVVNGANYQQYLSIQGDQLTLESVNEADEGSRNVQVRAYFAFAPEVESFASLTVIV